MLISDPSKLKPLRSGGKVTPEQWGKRVAGAKAGTGPKAMPAVPGRAAGKASADKGLASLSALGRRLDRPAAAAPRATVPAPAAPNAAADPVAAADATVPAPAAPNAAADPVAAADKQS